MKYRGDLNAAIHAGKMSSAAFRLLGLLERLDVSAAVFTHQLEVRSFVDRIAERRYQAYIEIFTDYPIN